MSCAFSLEAAFHGCPNVYGHFERSAFYGGFFLVPTVLWFQLFWIKLSLPIKVKQMICFLPVISDNKGVCDVYVTGREMHAGTFVRLLTVIQYIGFVAYKEAWVTIWHKFVFFISHRLLKAFLDRLPDT